MPATAIPNPSQAGVTPGLQKSFAIDVEVIEADQWNKYSVFPVLFSSEWIGFSPKAAEGSARTRGRTTQ